MSEPKLAARKDDLIVHDWGQLGSLFGFLAAAMWAGRAAKFLLVAAGPGGWVVFAATVAVEWAVSEAVEYVAFKIGDNIVTQGEPGIATGSTNVFINRREAARGDKTDDVICHPGEKLLGGSEWVSVNAKPAARIEDDLTESARIGSGSRDTLIGGPTVATSDTGDIQAVLEVLFLMSDLHGNATDLGKAFRAEGIGGFASELGSQAASEAIGTALDELWGQVGPE